MINKIKNLLEKNWFTHSLLLITLSIIAAGKLVVNRALGGFGFEPDSYLHFLQAEAVYSQFPDNLSIAADVWAKPLYTLVHGAWLSLLPDPSLEEAKILNVIIVALCSILVFAISKQLKLSNLYALAAALISNLDFLVFRSSITVLTEPIFTLVFLSSIYLWLKDKRILSALIIGISVLGRLEALLFVGIWGLMIAIKAWQRKKLSTKDIAAIVLLVVPTLMWNLVGYLLTDRPLFLISDGYPTEAGVYGFGHPLYYMEGLYVQAGIVTTLVTLAAINCYKKWDWEKFDKRWHFLTIILTSFILVQSLLFTFGLFGTAGLLRYFIPIMPLLAIIAVAFLQDLAKRIDWDYRQQISFLAVVIVFIGLGSITILQNGGFFKGLDNRPADRQGFRQVSNDPEVQLLLEQDDVFLYSNRPEVIYYADYSLNSASYQINFDTSNVNQQSVIILDEEWLQDEGDLLQDLVGNSEFTQIKIKEEYSNIQVFYNFAND